MTRQPPKPALVFAMSATLGVVVFGVAVRFGWIQTGVSASTSVWTVLGVVAVASAIVLLIARATRLPELADLVFSVPRSASDVTSDFLRVIELARSQGILVAAAEVRGLNIPLFTAGLHLLAEDADRRLIRAALEGQAEAEQVKLGARRKHVRVACQATLAAGVAGVVGSLLAASFAAADAWNLPWPSAVVILGGLAWFSVAVAVAPAIMARLCRRAAYEEFLAAAVVEAIMSIHAREGSDAAAERLNALLPSVPDRSGSPVISRRAA